MATGRTVSKYARVYMDGYDLSGYTRSIGPLDITFDEESGVTYGDPVTGAYAGHGMVSPGPLNGVFDNTATIGLHAAASGAGVKRDVLVALGIQSAPTEGDPAFMCEALQGAYKAEPAGGSLVGASIPFGPYSVTASTLLYARPWGYLEHALAAETAANTATGLDHTGAATAAGGYMMYHVTAGDGTCTLKIQDAATNLDGSFGDLVSSGEIDASGAPLSGVVALGTTAAVKRYTRWQLSLNTATTVTFVLGFVRG